MMKKSFLKPVISVLLAGFSVLGLSGCHGSSGMNEFSVPESFDESEKLEITFWAKNDTNKAQTLIYEKAATDFEALYPNIDVNIRFYTDYGTIYNDVITNISTNTTPNVCITYPDHIATYLTGENVVVPLDSLMEDERFGLGGSEVKFDSPDKNEVIDKFLEEGRFGDHYYALPYMRSTEACYVNKTFVEELGYELPEILTWDFVWEVSEAAMEKDENDLFKINGQNVLIPFIYKSTDNMMIQMLKQLDAPYSNENGEILLFNDTTKGLLEEIAAHGRSRAFSTFKISSYPANFLNAGQCIFAVDSTAGSTWMGTDAPLCDIAKESIVDFETEVRMIPQFDPENPKMISQGPSVCIFNKDNENEVLASWLFAQFLLTNDVQIAYSKTEGYSPVTSKALESEEYKDYLSRIGENNTEFYEVKLKAVDLLQSNIDNTFVTPVFNGSASLRDASGTLIENTVKAVRRSQTVDEAFYEKLYSDVNSLYRLDQKNEGAASDGKKDLGPLPVESKTLIIALLIVWAFIIIYYVKERLKQK